MGDKEVDHLPVDSSLDKLLQDALADFSRPDLLPSEKERQREASNSSSATHVIDGAVPSRDAASGPSSSKSTTKKSTDNTSNDAFLDETEKEIDEVLTSIAQEDPGLAEQLRALTDCAAGVSNSDHNEAMKSFTQFTALFKETLKSVSNQSGVPTEELLDEDLDDLMENLDKLALGQPGNMDGQQSRRGNLDFSVPLNDVLKALLAKDIMYASLQRCEEEFMPWLATNRASLSPVDLKRYESQLVSVKNLLREYQSQTDKPSSDDHFHRLIYMIAELQDLGSFPEELMAKVNTDVFNVSLPKPTSSRATAADGDDLEPPDCKTS